MKSAQPTPILPSAAQGPGGSTKRPKRRRRTSVERERDLQFTEAAHHHGNSATSIAAALTKHHAYTVSGKEVTEDLAGLALAQHLEESHTEAMRRELQELYHLRSLAYRKLQDSLRSDATDASLTTNHKKLKGSDTVAYINALLAIHDRIVRLQGLGGPTSQGTAQPDAVIGEEEGNDLLKRCVIRAARNDPAYADQLRASITVPQDPAGAVLSTTTAADVQPASPGEVLIPETKENTTYKLPTTEAP